MSRTVIQLKCENPSESEKVIKKILSSYNYELKRNDDEEYYKCGAGFLTAPKFIKYTFNGNDLTLEGWVRAFAFGGESELKGFVAGVPKRSCRKTLDDIQNNLDVSSVNDGIVITAEEKSQRRELIEEIGRKGFEQVMEEAAYTWFNRFVALRFMEVNGYLPSKVRVFTDENGAFKPDVHF